MIFFNNQKMFSKISFIYGPSIALFIFGFVMIIFGIFHKSINPDTDLNYLLKLLKQFKTLKIKVKSLKRLGSLLVEF